MDTERAYVFRSRHRDGPLKSGRAGCFHGREIFDPAEIAEWIDEPPFAGRPPGQTAMCPRCGMDAVLAGADLRLSQAFLKQMNTRWFGA